MEMTGEGGSRAYSSTEQRHPPELPLPEGPAPGEEREPNPAETRVIHSAFNIDEDGYGSQSRQAVANLQLANNIPVDSIVSIGVKTWHLITQVYEHAMANRQESGGENRAQAVEQSSQVERESAEVRHHRNKEQWLYEQEHETSPAQDRQPTASVQQEPKETSQGEVFWQDALNRALGKSKGEDLRELQKDAEGRTIIPQLEQGDHVVTLLFHGINGSKGTFEAMGKELAQSDDTRVVYISPEDTLCTLAPKVRNLQGVNVIRVEFTFARDDMDRGSEQIKELMVAIADSRAGHATFNLVGHSAGGVMATRAIQLMGPEPPVHVQALVTVDSPMSGSDATNAFELFSLGRVGEMSEDLLRHSAFIERVQANMDRMPPNLFKVSVASRDDEVVDVRSQTGLRGAYVHMTDRESHFDITVLNAVRYEPITRSQGTIDFVNRLLHNQTTAADFDGISNGDAGYHTINPSWAYYTAMTWADAASLVKNGIQDTWQLSKDLALDGGTTAWHLLENEGTTLWKTGSQIVDGFSNAGSEFAKSGQQIYDAANNGQWGKALWELGATPVRAGRDLVEGLGKGAWEFGTGQVETMVDLYQDGRQLVSDFVDNGVELVRDGVQSVTNYAMDTAGSLVNGAKELSSAAVSGVKWLFGW